MYRALLPSLYVHFVCLNKLLLTKIDYNNYYGTMYMAFSKEDS